MVKIKKMRLDQFDKLDQNIKKVVDYIFELKIENHKLKNEVESLKKQLGNSIEKGIEDLDKKKIQNIIDKMFTNVPSGLGSKAKVRLNRKQLDDVLQVGAQWAVENGYGWEEDAEFLEENGCLKQADISKVSEKAKQRGAPQLGSLGAGNHFLEIQKVAEIYDPVAAKAFGVNDVGQIMVMIHTGSRGFGHQVCTDHLQVLEQAVKKYNIWLPDRQ